MPNRTSDSPVSPHNTFGKHLVPCNCIDERKGLQYAKCGNTVSVCCQLLNQIAGLHVVSPSLFKYWAVKCCESIGGDSRFSVWAATIVVAMLCSWGADSRRSG